MKQDVNRYYVCETYRDRRGRYRWRFVAPNGNIMADSGQGYARNDAAVVGFRRLRRVLFTGTAYVVRKGKR